MAHAATANSVLTGSLYSILCNIIINAFIIFHQHVLRNLLFSQLVYVNNDCNDNSSSFSIVTYLRDCIAT